MPDFDAISDAARSVRAIVVDDDGAQAGQVAELFARVRGAQFEVIHTRRQRDQPS